jgi:hypothetical protein
MMFRTFLILILIFMLGCQPRSEKPVFEKHWLAGNWTAKAFSGRLDEYWKVDSPNGLILKAGYYIEDADTSYSETLKIDTLGGSVFMVAKPFNSDSRIYTLKRQTADSLIFENQVYRNPFRIVYVRTDNNHFTRLITGIEHSDTVRIKFEFERME